jgi:rhodanese-related sulfurtransferase
MSIPAVGRISPDEIRTRRSRGDTVIALDVRTADARSVQPCEIPGTMWLPLPAVVAQSGQLPKDATIVAYCT